MELFNKSSGNLAPLLAKKPIREMFEKFMPKYQTAFDAMFIIQPTVDEMMEAYPSDDVRPLLIEMAFAVCEIGINPQTFTQLDRLVAMGPIKPQSYSGISIPTPCVTSQFQKWQLMCLLIFLIEVRANANGLNWMTYSETREAIMTDLIHVWGIEMEGTCPL